jgi:hypothetical protein
MPQVWSETMKIAVQNQRSRPNEAIGAQLNSDARQDLAPIRQNALGADDDLGFVLPRL